MHLAPVWIISVVSCLLVATFAAAEAATSKADFYVATDGNDAWSGRFAVANASASDGPFASVARAQKAMREIRADVSDRPVSVLIRGGIYRLAQPLTFTPQDSGFENAPTIYAAYPGEQPVFSGGRPITGWTKGEGELWIAEIPQVKSGDWYFHQLFVNGKRRTRARHPNEGYLRIAGTLKPLTDRSAARGDTSYKIGFRYHPGDIKHSDGLEDLNIILYHSWTASLHWIKELDEQSNTVHFTARCAWPVAYWDANERYHLENYFEALDAPGEWYLNRKTGILYYWPFEGEDMQEAEVNAPRLQHLVEIRGDAQAGNTVEYLVLRGLSFQHAEWVHPKNKMADGQAAMHLSAAVVATWARHCSIERCEIAHVGEYGLILGEGCKHNRVCHCHIHDLGGGGVRLGETLLHTDPERQTDHNVVDNCFIHDGGHVFKAGIGVWIGRSSYNTVSHNEICDFYYSGCSVGWSWGYAPSSANHNVFEYNHIHNLGKGVLSDMGGIYSLGVSPGSVERFNLIHDVYSYAYGGWGLYTDEGSTDILLENNVVYNCKTGCFHQHYGRTNTIRNNIFAVAQTGNIVRSRQEEHLSFTFKRNIVLTNNGVPLGGNWGNGNYRIDYNIYWDIADEDIEFAGMEFEEWQELGRDRHSRIADPLFVDAQNYDFRLREDSPVRKWGFEPIDISKIGLYGETEWVNAPKKIVRKPLDRPPAPEPQPIIDDFEDTEVGENAKLARTHGQSAGAGIRVTDEQAATGNHSLKFTDAPGLEHDWQPHMYYQPRFSKGLVRFSFDLRVEPGAIFWHEWRDAHYPYRVGPSISIEKNGELRAGGNPLMTVPHSKWTHIEIACGLGKIAGAYDLKVTVQGQEPHRFEKLPNGSPQWRRLRWLGFVSLATDTAVFYIDNVKLDAE